MFSHYGVLIFWISKATCTHAHTHAYALGHMHARVRAHTHKYVIFIAFPRQQCFANRLSVTLYVHCLSCSDYPQAEIPCRGGTKYISLEWRKFYLAFGRSYLQGTLCLYTRPNGVKSCKSIIFVFIVPITSNIIMHS